MTETNVISEPFRSYPIASRVAVGMMAIGFGGAAIALVGLVVTLISGAWR